MLNVYIGQQQLVIWTEHTKEKQFKYTFLIWSLSAEEAYKQGLTRRQ